ncbi:MAG: hypothetical protein E6I94_04750, partial [Chloroflexi bacterium]
MSTLPLLALAFGGAAATLLARRWPDASTAIGLAGLVAAFVAASGIVPGDEIPIAGGALVGSAYARLFLQLGAGIGLVLTMAGRLALGPGWPAYLPGALLAGLGAACLGLTVRDTTTAIVATIGGGLAGVLLTVPEPASQRTVAVAARELRAIAVAGSLVIVATAWVARPLGVLVQDPAVFGLAYLGVALGVAMRFGAIPFHLWAARVAEAAPEIALPVLMAWGPAVLAVVGLAWVDGSIAPVLPVAGELPAERALIIGVGVSSMILGAIAAWIQDDLEHVVGYTIMQDAGVVVLAFAALDPGVWAPSRTWVLCLLAARTAFAAWAMAIDARFGTRRVPDLGGWARRSPVLAIALAAIAIASVGWPGLAAFEARASIITQSVDEPLAALILLGAVLPLLYYARLFAIGIARPSRASAAAADDRLRRPSLPPPRRIPSGPLPSPWSLRTWGSWDALTRSIRLLRGLRPLPDVAAAALEVNRSLLVGILVLVLSSTAGVVSAGGFGLAAAAAEPAPQVPGTGEEPGPGSSPGPIGSPEIPGASGGPATPGGGPGESPGGSSRSPGPSGS